MYYIYDWININKLKIVLSFNIIGIELSGDLLYHNTSLFDTSSLFAYLLIGLFMIIGPNFMLRVSLERRGR